MRICLEEINCLIGRKLNEKIDKKKKSFGI